MVAFTQAPQKREVRGAWVAAVENYDWPSKPGMSAEEQKTELIKMLDILKYSGINTVFLHVRPECDALYKSSYEPWSYWLTGVQGKAPSPDYDPLAFAVEETHKRGMELHAWFNPYRAVKTVGKYVQATNHVSNLHPEWILTKGSYKFLNPGLPEVESYIIKVIKEIVQKYDIDGIHFDDYFYPYSPDNMVANDVDLSTFQKYNRGIVNIDDWRRDNINQFIKHLKDTVFSIKPYVKYGVSPFGIWKSGTPNGISGMDAYSVIFCDALAWLRNKSVDYIVPQLYWPFGGAQDYATLMSWWSDSASKYGVNFMSGNAAYKTSSYGSAEIPKQIRYNRSKSNKCIGSVLFEGKDFKNNPLAFADSLILNVYPTPALVPVMDGKGSASLQAPTNLRVVVNSGNLKTELRWDYAKTYRDGVKFIIYRFNTSTPTANDYNNPANIFAIVGENRLDLKYGSYANISGNYFAVTVADRNWNESLGSNIVQMNLADPQPPVCLYPVSGYNKVSQGVEICWKGDAMSAAYEFTLASDAQFKNLLVKRPLYKDTFFVFNGTVGQTTYYWRVKALNNKSVSNYSDTFTFTTGYPTTVNLLEPKNASLSVPVNVSLKWQKNPNATQYEIMIDNAGSFINIVKDTIVSDTVLCLNNLLYNKIYYWKVKPSSNLGNGTWSNVFGFKTGTISNEVGAKLPKEFTLAQNYPNPFNPSTKIKLALPISANVKLTVYNAIGQQVTQIVNNYMEAGYHSVDFNASNLPSGMYFYKIKAGNFESVKKMLLVK